MQRMDRKKLEKLYDLARGMLRPAYDRLEDAHHIKRDPFTDEVSWPPTSLEDRLRKAGLI